MKKSLKILRTKRRYHQKTDWDRIADSYLKSSNPILEIGCGQGRFISQEPHAIIGVDLNHQSSRGLQTQRL